MPKSKDKKDKKPLRTSVLSRRVRIPSSTGLKEAVGARGQTLNRAQQKEYRREEKRRHEEKIAGTWSSPNPQALSLICASDDSARTSRSPTPARYRRRRRCSVRGRRRSFGWHRPGGHQPRWWGGARYFGGWPTC